MLVMKAKVEAYKSQLAEEMKELDRHVDIIREIEEADYQVYGFDQLQYKQLFDRLDVEISMAGQESAEWIPDHGLLFSQNEQEIADEDIFA